MPHSNGSKRLLHGCCLHRHSVVDDLHVGIGVAVDGSSGVVDIVRVVHRHVDIVQSQLFTHLASLFFCLLSKSLIVQKPLEVMLSQCLGSVEIGRRFLVELVIGINQAEFVVGRLGRNEVGRRSGSG